MKKVLFSILAVGAIVACTKSEVNYNDASEIAFAPVASTATKANVMNVIDGTEYPAKENFRVYAYWQLLDANTEASEFAAASTYIAGKTFQKNGDFWTGSSKSYYWPKTGSLVFSCFSPAAPGFDVTHTLFDDKGIYADNFHFEYDGPLNDDKEFDTARTIDFMWANATTSYDEATGENGVEVVFNHAQSWITFKVKGDGVTSANDPNKGFVINSLTMNKVKYTGEFDSYSEAKWDLKDWAKDVAVWTGNKNLTSEYVVIENVTNGTLVLPQKTAEKDGAGNEVKDSEGNVIYKDYIATIEFTNNLGDTPIKEVVTINLGKEWEIGKHYTYLITFTAKEILVSPEVTDWTDVADTVIPSF